MRFPIAAVPAAGFAAVAFVVSLGASAPAELGQPSVVALTTPPVFRTPAAPSSAPPMVTSVALTSSDGTNVACPATINVTATVTGVAGQYLHVVVQANFNGQGIAIDGTRSSPDETMMTTGTYTRTFAVPLPVLSGQGNSIQLIAWQDGNTAPFTTASDVATFVPTCKPPPTPQPTATPSPSPTPPNGNDLGIPTNLIAVHTAQTCQGLVLASVVGSGCASAVQKGELVLAWSYTSLSHCEPKCATPTAYVVERSQSQGGAFSPFQLAAYDPATPAADGLISSVPYASYGTCYRVAALRGSNDLGPASTPLCIIPDPVTLNATAIYSALSPEHWKQSSFGLPCSPDANPIGHALVNGIAQGDFIVGFLDSSTYSNLTSCGEEYYYRWQADIVFPLTSLPWKNVAHATFTATIVDGVINAGSTGLTSYFSPNNGTEVPEQVDCVATVGFPANFTPGHSLPAPIIHNNLLTLNPGGKATSVSLDVTSLVNTWLGPGGVNNGMVLSAQTWTGNYSPNLVLSDLPDPSNSECLTHFSNAQLVVSY